MLHHINFVAEGLVIVGVIHVPVVTVSIQSPLSIVDGVRQVLGGLEVKNDCVDVSQ